MNFIALLIKLAFALLSNCDMDQPKTGTFFGDPADRELQCRCGTTFMRVKAEETYRRDLIDVEVQMISKVSTAVKNHLKGIQKKREAKKWPQANTPFTPAPRRRDLYKNQETVQLGKRVGLE